MKGFVQICIVVAALASSGACSPRDPLAGLSSEDKLFLLADTQTNAPFLGQPLDNGPLNCYPQRMNQGYALIDTENALWLDSIRPSGVERHKILAVSPTDGGFVVKAKNGVGVNFELLIEQKDNDIAMISWDGAPAEIYRRCPNIQVWRGRSSFMSGAWRLKKISKPSLNRIMRARRLS